MFVILTLLILPVYVVGPRHPVLRENVIMGRLIPAGTGLERYRNIQLLTEMPPPPEEIPPPAELSVEEAAALDFLRKDADAMAEGSSD